MANVTETSTWEAGIYQLETTDPVEGGALGISNKQAKQLGNRTKWLFDKCNPFLYEVRELDIPNSELSTFVGVHFDGTGKGINSFDGWAICNGQNNTRNRAGRTSIGYGGGYSIGETGGSEDAVVVEHNHGAGSYGVGEGAPYYTNIGLQSGLASIFSSTFTAGTGETGADKNMQPYIVTLFIQKIA